MEYTGNDKEAFKNRLNTLKNLGFTLSLEWNFKYEGWDKHSSLDLNSDESQYEEAFLLCQNEETEEKYRIIAEVF
jgi:hypothetical protein